MSENTKKSVYRSSVEPKIARKQRLEKLGSKTDPVFKVGARIRVRYVPSRPDGLSGCPFV